MPDQAHRETDKELEKMERKLRTVYGQAAARSQQKANRFFEKFAKLDRIKQQQVKEGKLDQETYLTWRRNKMAMGENYRAMVDTLTSDMVNTNQIAASVVNGHLPEVYANNYNFGTYQIEHDSQIDTSFTLYDRQTVERLMRDNPDVIPIKARVDIPKDKLWNKRKINDVITQSILTGDSIPDIAKSLQKVAEMNKVAAVRTARTATTSAQNGGRVDSYKRAQEMGIKLRQQWLATLDGRTRDSHRALDGEIIAVAKDKWHPAKFSNGCRFPGDPQGPGHEIYNCRCTLLGVVDGVDFDLSDVTQRDSKLGEQSYDEWKAGHKKKQQKSPGVKPDKETGLLYRTGYAFTEKTTKVYGDLNSLINATDEQTRAVWLMHAPDLDYALPADAKFGTAYYSAYTDHRVHFDETKVVNGGALHPPYETFFHEYGHNIDWLYAEKAGLTTKNVPFTDIWRDKSGRKLEDVITQEWEDKFRLCRNKQDVAQKMFAQQLGEGGMDTKVFLRSLLADYRRDNSLDRRSPTYLSLKEELENAKTKSQQFDFFKKHTELIPKDSLDYWFSKMDNTAMKEYISDIKNTHSLSARGNLSDMFERFTVENIGVERPLGAGHGKDYATESGSLGHEAFAEMFASEMSNPASLELIKRELPNSYQAYRSMLNVMLEED